MMACEVGCFYVKQPNVKGISGDAVKAENLKTVIQGHDLAYRTISGRQLLNIA